MDTASAYGYYIIGAPWKSLVKMLELALERPVCSRHAIESAREFLRKAQASGTSEAPGAFALLKNAQSLISSVSPGGPWPFRYSVTGPLILVPRYIKHGALSFTVGLNITRNTCSFAPCWDSSDIGHYSPTAHFYPFLAFPWPLYLSHKRITVTAQVRSTACWHWHTARRTTPD
jgi:hypothetical protein